MHYFCFAKAKIGGTLDETNKFASPLGLHYFCFAKAKIGGTSDESNKFASPLGLHYLCSQNQRDNKQ